MRKTALSISILLIGTVFFSGTGQQGFSINVHVNGISNGTVFYIKNWRDNVILDSGYVRKGRFSLKGCLTGTEKLLLYASDSITREFIYTNLIIGNENVTINANKNDFPWNIDASGSESQDIAEKFNQTEYQRQQLRKRAKADNEKQFNNKLKNISDSLDNVQVELIKRNFNSYAALFNFKYYKVRFSSDELVGLYKKLRPELRQSNEGRAIKIQSQFPAPEEGDPYYDYAALNQNEDTVSLSDISGKYILLHFAAAGCYYSQQSLPELRDVYKRYKDKLEIVRISEDVSKDVWTESIKRDSIMWTNVWDGKGEYGDAVIKYGVIGTPNYVLISPAKIIVTKWFGYRDRIIMEKIETYLK